MQPYDDSIIASLLTRNEEWAAGINRMNPKTFLRMATVPQRPKVLWIGCADSRVPESVITASVPGDIFVHRNIANQFSSSDSNAASIVQYAVQSIRVTDVVVVGHTHCGGVHAALGVVNGGAPLNGPLGQWLGDLVDLAKGLPPPVEEAALTYANVARAVSRVRDFISNLKGSPHHVNVVGMVYELEMCHLMRTKDHRASQRATWSYNPLDFCVRAAQGGRSILSLQR